MNFYYFATNNNGKSFKELSKLDQKVEFQYFLELASFSSCRCRFTRFNGFTSAVLSASLSEPYHLERAYRWRGRQKRSNEQTYVRTVEFTKGNSPFWVKKRHLLTN